MTYNIRSSTTWGRLEAEVGGARIASRRPSNNNNSKSTSIGNSSSNSNSNSNSNSKSNSHSNSTRGAPEEDVCTSRMSKHTRCKTHNIQYEFEHTV